MKIMIMYFITLILAIWVAQKLKKDRIQKVTGNRNEFDERQLLARGMAYKWGFATMLIYFGVNAFVITYLGYQWCPYDVSVAIGIGISMTVFAIICIWKDAYVSLGSNGTYYYGVVVLVGLLNLIIGIMGDNFHREEIVNNQIKNVSISLICGIVLLVVAIAGIIKCVINRREEE